MYTAGNRPIRSKETSEQMRIEAESPHEVQTKVEVESPQRILVTGILLHLVEIWVSSCLTLPDLTA